MQSLVPGILTLQFTYCSEFNFQENSVFAIKLTNKHCIFWHCCISVNMGACAFHYAKPIGQRPVQIPEENGTTFCDQTGPTKGLGMALPIFKRSKAMNWFVKNGKANFGQNAPTERSGLPPKVIPLEGTKTDLYLKDLNTFSFAKEIKHFLLSEQYSKKFE